MTSLTGVHACVPSTAVFKPDIFKGKVLFCTGGGSGICKGMTKGVMLHGANAVIVGRNLNRLKDSAAELSRLTGKECIPAQADVRRPEQLRAAVAITIEKFGRIDFVICGAAGNFLAPISGMSENAFKSVIDIDVLGMFNTIKATLPHVRQAKGSYIHVSVTIHYRATPYQAHVSAAKAAIDAASAVLAVEEGPHGVRSNVLAPGPIGESEGVIRLRPKDSDVPPWKNTPVQRDGTFGDCANATVFLFSDAASFITGSILVNDGGWSHLSNVGSAFPYPQSVLDPESILGVRAKM